MKHTSYMARVGEALEKQDWGEFDRIVEEFFPECTEKYLRVVREYGFTDLPLTIAVMKIMIQALTPIMDESGKGICDFFQKTFNVTTIDLAGLRKQMEDEQKE